MNKHEIERIFAYDSGRKPHRYASGAAPHADGDITVVRRPNLRMTFRTAPGCPLARPGAPFDANEPVVAQLATILARKPTSVRSTATGVAISWTLCTQAQAHVKQPQARRMEC